MLPLPCAARVNHIENLRRDRCLTWHLRFPAALKHVDVGCKFREIRISLSAAQRP
jgi:hypothetical protein